MTISDFDDIELTTTTAKEQQKSIFLKYMENRRSHRLWLLRMSSTMEFILMDNNLLTNSFEGRRVKELANHSKHLVVTTTTTERESGFEEENDILFEGKGCWRFDLAGEIQQTKIAVLFNEDQLSNIKAVETKISRKLFMKLVEKEKITHFVGGGRKYKKNHQKKTLSKKETPKKVIIILLLLMLL